MRATMVCAVLLALGCAGSPTREIPLGRAEAAAFVESFERAIAAGEWEAVRDAFLPDAFVLYQEIGQDAPSRLPPDLWVAALAGAVEETDFSRRREILSIEVRSEVGRVVLKSHLVETVLRGNAVLEVTTDEMMTVARRDGTIGILGLALFIGGIGVEDVEWL